MDKYNIDKILVMSTSHLTKATCEALDSGFPWLARSFDFGAMVWVDTTDGPNQYASHPDLTAPMALASSLDCQWIMFDSDAAIIESLPRYEWEK